MLQKGVVSMDIIRIFRIWAFSLLTYSTMAKDEYTVCESDVCLRRAELISASLNTSVNPCENFYSYACGGWQQKHVIPEHRSSYGEIERLADQLLETLKGILERIAPSNVSQNVTEKLAVAYKSCVDSSSKEDVPSDMINILEESGLVGWPITSEDSGVSQTLTSCTIVLLKTGIHPVLEMYVGKSPGNSGTNVIQVDQIGFHLMDKETLLSLKENGYESAYKRLIKEVLKFVNQKASPTELDKVTDSVLRFEQQLASLTASSDEREDIYKIYVKTTIGELQDNFSTFPLLEFLNNEFSPAKITLTKDDFVDLYALEYYKKLTKFLETASPVDLFNYAGYRVMLNLGKHASKTFQKALTDFKNDAFEYTNGNVRWKECIKLMKEAMAEIIGYIYVSDKFSAESKKEVEIIAGKIKDAYMEILQNSEWMDSAEKEAATHKLKEMAAKIGYPDWQLDVGYLEALYKHVPHHRANSPFVRVWYDISQNNWINHLSKLRESVARNSDWPVGPAEVNAFYTPYGNEIVYPAGILQPPFYERGLPWSLKMGSLGAMMAHEMTHGFDLAGRRFDANGELVESQSGDTSESFETKARCFREQYGNITDPDANIPLNGEQTLNENIADNGGLQVAFAAYQHILNEKDPTNKIRLKGLENLSSMKLFFIGNAMTWCGRIEQERLKYDIEESKYSPNKYRASVPIENMKEFATAFECPNESPMNPAEKCILW
uniref:Putative m13 family peptidase n=1 Tax=Amblyomma triste TaxID=251400 RepID=A0A023GNH0_AMBTT